MQFVWENFYNYEFQIITIKDYWLLKGRKGQIKRDKGRYLLYYPCNVSKKNSYQDFHPLLQHFKLWTSLLGVEAAEPRVWKMHFNFFKYPITEPQKRSRMYGEEEN